MATKIKKRYEGTVFVALRVTEEELEAMTQAVHGERIHLRETVRTNDIRKLPPLARVGLRIVAAAVATRGECMICGCTWDNCILCIEATGAPCSWVNDEETICSACL